MISSRFQPFTEVMSNHVWLPSKYAFMNAAPGGQLRQFYTDQVETIWQATYRESQDISYTDDYQFSLLSTSQTSSELQWVVQLY